MNKKAHKCIHNAYKTLKARKANGNTQIRKKKKKNPLTLQLNQTIKSNNDKELSPKRINTDPDTSTDLFLFAKVTIIWRKTVRNIQIQFTGN